VPRPTPYGDNSKPHNTLRAICQSPERRLPDLWLNLATAANPTSPPGSRGAAGRPHWNSADDRGRRVSRQEADGDLAGRHRCEELLGIASHVEAVQQQFGYVGDSDEGSVRFRLGDNAARADSPRVLAEFIEYFWQSFLPGPLEACLRRLCLRQSQAIGFQNRCR